MTDIRLVTYEEFEQADTEINNKIISTNDSINEIGTRTTNVEAKVEEISGKISFIVGSTTMDNDTPVGTVQFVGGALIDSYETTIEIPDNPTPDDPILY